MGRHITSYIGPYAEWRVDRGEEADRPSDDEPRDGQVLAEGGLFLARQDGEVPEAEIDGVRYARYRFLPDAKRPNAPPRKMYLFSDIVEEEDWSWIDPRAEMDWFSEAFASELATLTTHFGAEPILGWGVVISF